MLPVADAGPALRRARPRALVVGAGAARSASGRSTSTGCTRTSASSSRSSSRRCSSGTCGRAAACSIRSPAPGRRSCRRSSRATTRSASTSPRSTRSSCSVKTPRARPRDAGGRGSRGSGRLGRVDRAADGLRARLVRAGGGGGAAALPLAGRGVREPDVLRVVLARAARSARLTTHFDLDFPRAPQRGRVLVPQAPAHVPAGRERRQVPDPLPRRHGRPDRGVRAVRDPRRAAVVLHGDARELELGGPYDGVVTSPPTRA